jgi:hypothetical protein
VGRLSTAPAVDLAVSALVDQAVTVLCLTRSGRQARFLVRSAVAHGRILTCDTGQR